MISALSKFMPAVTIIIVAVIVLIIVLVLKKKLKPEENEVSVNEVEKEIQTDKLSYDKSKYSQYADALFTAMDGLTEDENMIYSIMRKMQNDDDLKALIVAFGVREGSTWGILKNFNVNGNLSQWFSELLTDSEISEINKILQKNDINYTF